jgi:DNA-directed RNA polymerase specialized sigma subunit
MATVKYLFKDGLKDVECTEEFATKYAEFVQEQKRLKWREKWRAKRTDSLDGLYASGQEVADPINRDPLEILIAREEPDLPLFTGLTDYQRRVAAKFYIDHRTHEEIAAEEGVSQPAITKLIKKIQNKIAGIFD